MTTAPTRTIATDTLVIGAGPAGLYAAFQLGLLGLDAHLIDALPAVGGQCQALYADKPIYDIPGMARTTGQALSASLLAQLQNIQAFAPLENRLHLGQLVTQIAQIKAIESTPEAKTSHGAALHTYRITSNAGLEFLARSIIVAAGVGAFLPRSLNIPDLHTVAACIHHQPSTPAAFVGQSVLIVGEEDEAVHWACDLAQSGQVPQVTLNHRRARLNASAQAQARLEACITQGGLRFAPGLIQGITHTHGQLQSVRLLQPDGSTIALPCTRLGILLGLSPQLGPLADWGLALQRKLLPVDSARFATPLDGVFAIGDVVSYPGKLKLIACAFHEATLAAHAALAHTYPERVTPLQYTSSSAQLQARLSSP